MALNDGASAPINDSDPTRKRRVGLTLTAILTVIYLAYLALIIYAPAAMSMSVGGNLTWGLALGAAVVFAALALGFVYVSLATDADQRAGGKP
jgi:uncharacterized membrane protein (DUF485 family)